MKRGAANDIARLLVLGALSWLPEAAAAPLLDGYVARTVPGGRSPHEPADWFPWRLLGLPQPLTERAARRLDARNRHLDRILALRTYRPLAPLPRTRLEGAAHLEDARAAGRGAILWVAPFVGSSLAAKAALARAGYPMVYLSRSGHGISGRPFAVRHLNRIRQRAENRFLAGRVVMHGPDTTTAMRSLLEHLAANRLVGITVGVEARQLVTVPFAGGTLRLANGPARLAVRTGAALLPVFTLRDATGAYRVIVEPPLPLGDGDSPAGRIAAAVAAYADRLEPHARSDGLRVALWARRVYAP